jgi:hypothetical protein
MSPTLTCFALAMVGVDLGYQPAPDGGMEYTIQISPASLRTFRPGDPFELDVPREVQNLRTTHFRVTTGDERLPRILPAAAPASAAAAAPPATAPNVQATLMPQGRAMQASSAEAAPGDSQSRYSRTQRPPETGPNDWPAVRSAPARPNGSQTSAETGQGPALSGSGEVRPQPAGSAAATIPALPPADSQSGNPPEPSKPGLVLLLLLVVIVLSASNGYTGWLFWDARQRYLGLLARTFSAMKQPAEAS